MDERPPAANQLDENHVQVTNLQGERELKPFAYYKQMILRCRSLHLCGRLMCEYVCDMFSRTQDH